MKKYQLLQPKGKQMKNKENRVPIIEPLLLLLKSRRVMLSVINLVIVGLIMWIPELETLQTELLTILTAVYLALVTGISWEDAAAAGRNQELSDNWQDEMTDVIRETILLLADTSDIDATLDDEPI